jgi:hypothetical protein
MALCSELKLTGTIRMSGFLFSCLALWIYGI